MSLPEQRFRSDLEAMVREQSGTSLYKRVPYKGKDLRLVTARHSSKAAGDIFETEIAQQIEDPDKWLFLIEGLGEPLYEVEVATLIAQEHDIPCVDPIFSFDQIEVVDGLLATRPDFPLTREELKGSLVLEVLRLHRSTDIRLPHTALVDFGSEEEMRDDLSAFISSKAHNQPLLENSIMQSMHGLIEVSNFFSTQILDYYLRQYEDRSDIAMYCGKLHENVSALTENDIPESLHFSEGDIIKLLARRESRIQERDRRIGIVS